MNIPKELYDKFKKNSETYQKNPMAIWADFLGSDTMRRLARNAGIEYAKKRREHIFKLIAEINSELGQKDKPK